MVFSSATFLFLFLPLVIASYYAMPYFLRNFWLLLASIFFYAWGSIDFILVLGGAIVVDYLIGFFLNSQKWGKAFFIFGILFNSNGFKWNISEVLTPVNLLSNLINSSNCLFKIGILVVLAFDLI